LTGIVGVADDGKVVKCVGGPRYGKALRDAQHDDVVKLPDGPGGAQAFPFRPGRNEHDPAPVGGT
jgi:hypothetical protein